MADPNSQNSSSNLPEVVDTTPSDSQPQLSPDISPPAQPTEPSSSRAPASQTCSTCSKPIETPKPCPRCHTTPYCSRECQKTDYKKHKKVCAELAQKYATTADIKMATNRIPPKDSRRGGLQKWQFDT